MEKILMFTKDQWVAIFQFIGTCFGAGAVVYGMAHKKINEFLKMRKDFYSKFALTNEGVKALLYTQIDKMLTTCERYNNITNQALYSQLVQLIRIYKEMGDGIDGGNGFDKRLSDLTVDDVKFHELQVTINEFKKEALNDI